MTLAYSPSAEVSRAYLLRSFNDLDIFVEDVKAQNSYIRLFRRMLNGVATINHVFPLQSRQNVIAACSKDQAARTRKRLYIIDGDLDLIQGIAPPSLMHFYRLSVYCSENLLLSKVAAIEIAAECESNTNWIDLAAKLNIEGLFEVAQSMLLPLFIAYAVSERLGLGIQTVKYPVQRLCSSPHEPLTLSGYLVRRRLEEVRNQILTAIPITAYRALRRQMMVQACNIPGKLVRLISGKTYLLPLLHLHLQSKVAFVGTVDSLKVRLAANCELDIDPGLQAALVSEAA